eukprot:14178169-Heterocapsa_arctica.AAC.1
MTGGPRPLMCQQDSLSMRSALVRRMHADEGAVARGWALAEHTTLHHAGCNLCGAHARVVGCQEDLALHVGLELVQHVPRWVREHNAIKHVLRPSMHVLVVGGPVRVPVGGGGS